MMQSWLAKITLLGATVGLLTLNPVWGQGAPPAASGAPAETTSRAPVAAGLVATMAVAVPIRTGWPASAPSPTKSPGPNVATTASLPVLETTASFTRPFCRWNTLSAGSPWA